MTSLRFRFGAHPVGVVLCLWAALLGGCALSPPPEEKPAAADKPVPMTLIQTAPGGAVCSLRGESSLERTIRTPEIVPLEAFGKEIRVTCFLADHFRLVTTVQPRSIKPLLRRILDREPLSLQTATIEDAEGGEDARPYPPQMLFRLRRDRFQTETERDVWYETLSAATLQDWRGVRAVVAGQCRPDIVPLKGGGAVSKPVACSTALDRLEKTAATELRSIEVDRRRAALP